MTARGWAQFGAVSLLWGVVYLLIKIAGDELSAPALTFARARRPCAVLLPLAARRGARPPLRPRRGAAPVLALLGVAVALVLIALGERWVPQARDGILVVAV